MLENSWIHLSPAAFAQWCAPISGIFCWRTQIVSSLTSSGGKAVKTDTCLLHVSWFSCSNHDILIFTWIKKKGAKCSCQNVLSENHLNLKNIRSNSLTKIIRCFHRRGFIEDSLENSLSKHNLTIHWVWQTSVPFPRITASHGDGNLMATLKENIGIGILGNTTEKIRCLFFPQIRHAIGTCQRCVPRWTLFCVKGMNDFWCEKQVV